MDSHGSIGDRIARYRKRRGLTQEVLAGRAGMSRSWLQKVESGERVMDRISTLLLLANVLKVKPGELIGRVELPPNGGAPTDPPRGIHAVRRALLAVRPADQAARPTSKLRIDVEQLKRLKYDGRPEAVSILLPELITDARAAVSQDDPGAWWCLAGACQVAGSLARTVGAVDLAWIAVDRAVSAAQKSGDLWLVAASERHLASALLREGLLHDAGTTCSDAADALAPDDRTPLEGWSVFGSLQVTEADTAARAGDTAAAWRLLRQARTAADRVGSGRNDYWEGFGPATVSVYEISVALESGDPVEGLRIADTVEVSELPSAESRARFCIHVARAHALRRDDTATIVMLLEAERYAPESVRYQIAVHELVRTCLGRERKSRTPGLRALAERVGVAG